MLASITIDLTTRRRNMLLYIKNDNVYFALILVYKHATLST